MCPMVLVKMIGKFAPALVCPGSKRASFNIIILNMCRSALMLVVFAYVY